MDSPIYLDHAATTPVAPEVLDAMLPYFRDSFANPAAIYGMASEARDAVENARAAIACAIGARPEEIYFTSGGTESNNWAVKGAARVGMPDHTHILTSPIEHSAILEPCDTLTSDGYQVEFLPVDGEGLMDPADVAARIRSTTALVSVMHANNEIGTIEPISEIGAFCRERGVTFHSDAVQALGKTPLDVRSLNVDLMSLSAHKIYGPKGAGALYVRRGTRLAPFMEGGEQEKSRRAGTLNVPGIVGFGKAVELSQSTLEAESERLIKLRDRLIEGVEATIPGAMLYGSRTARLPNNAHFCFDGIEGETLLLGLDMAGICASAGSACSAGSTEPSHVLLALGVSVEKARGALRLTLGRNSTLESIEYTVETLVRIVSDLRSLGSVEREQLSKLPV